MTLQKHKLRVPSDEVIASTNTVVRGHTGLCGDYVNSFIDCKLRSVRWTN